MTAPGVSVADLHGLEDSLKQTPVNIEVRLRPDARRCYRLEAIHVDLGDKETIADRTSGRMLPGIFLLLDVNGLRSNG